MTDTGPVRVTIIYPVRDFAQFAGVISSLPPVEGVLSRRVYRSIDDPGEVMFEIEMASYEHAKRMVKGADVRDILDRAGAEIYPPVFIGGEVGDLRFEAQG